MVAGMEPSPHKAPTLDYSNPLHKQQRPAALIWFLAVVSLFIAVITGDAVLDKFRNRQMTQAYTQYTVTRDWIAKNDSSYVPPPFTGRKFVYESPFELKSFYACVLFGAVGGLAIRSALRRQLPPGRGS